MEKVCRNRMRSCRMARLALGLGICAFGTVAAVAQDLTLPPQTSDFSMPSSTPGGKFAQAIQLLQAGKLKEADALFAQVSDSDPAHLDAALGRAQIALTEKQLDQADRTVSAVLKQHDNAPEAHNMKGLVLLLRKNQEGAKREFARAIELNPRYVTPRVYLAVMARVNRDYGTAAEQYRQLTVIAPHLQTGYLGGAEALAQAGHADQAIHVLEGWKVADPKTLLPYQVIANMDLAARKPQDAIRQLQAALAKAPRDSTTLTILGTAYADAGDVRQAENEYQAAIAANGTNVDAIVRLGELQAGAGQNEQAMKNFRVALQLDPRNAFALNDIAWMEADRGEHLDEALRLARTAVQVAPKYADARDTLGWVYYRQGNYVQAVSALKTAKTLAPTNPSIGGHLGLAYAKAGQRQLALVELKEALAQGNSVSDRPELEREVAELSAGKAGTATSRQH